MTLREQIEAVRVRLGAVTTELCTDYVTFNTRAGGWRFHDFQEGRSSIDGLPQWPRREARAQEVLVLYGGELSNLARASEHSFYLHVDAYEIEVWPEIRRCSVPAEVRMSPALYGALNGLGKLGYAAVSIKGVSACLWRRGKIGDEEAERLDAAEQHAMREGWHPYASNSQWKWNPTRQWKWNPAEEAQKVLDSALGIRALTGSEMKSILGADPELVRLIEQASQHGKQLDAMKSQPGVVTSVLICGSWPKGATEAADARKHAVGSDPVVGKSVAIKADPDYPPQEPREGWSVHHNGRNYIAAGGKWWVLDPPRNTKTYAASDVTFNFGGKELTPAKADFEATGPCPDCKGTGVYVGLFETEPCRTCQ